MVSVMVSASVHIAAVSIHVQGVMVSVMVSASVHIAIVSKHVQAVCILYSFMVYCSMREMVTV